MELDGRRIWQVAAGDGERAYHDLLIDWDAIAIGPGNYGIWPECEPRVIEFRTRNQATIIRRFAEHIQIGDLVVLRKGSQAVCAVGEVTSDYLWLDDFGDIDGWDLQHVRRVRWLWRYKDGPATFAPGVLRFGDSVQEACSEELLRWLRSLEIAKPAHKRELKVLPESCQHGIRRERVSLERLAEGLFDLGIGLSDANLVIDRMRELEMLSGWYDRAKDKPVEHETIAYLVVPLLRSLGWTPQRMAVEWQHIDLSLFARLPRNDANLSAVLEGKAMGRACVVAKEQGEGYVQTAERSQCERLIVTEGIRYAVFLKTKGKFARHPAAYINLIRRLESYPILHCDGTIQALALLSADWRLSA